MEIKVTDNEFIRIDKYLSNIDSFTRSKIKKLIDSNSILVNGKTIKASYLVKIDDLITIKEIKETEELTPINIPLDIVYEDEYLLVVNKQSGLVVHPGAGNHNNTLVNALIYHCKENLSTINGSTRPGIVHRIDADTTGLLLVAKNDLVHNYLAKDIADKKVQRKYLALVHGVINEDTATIDAPIGRDKKDRKKMCITIDNSKPAITHIKVLKRYHNTTLIECTLETGRTHQIRVHMAYINHPVVNDHTYGYTTLDKKIINENVIDKDKVLKYLEFGQLLHAKEIIFTHPITKEVLDFKASVPQTFKEIEKIYTK